MKKKPEHKSARAPSLPVTDFVAFVRVGDDVEVRRDDGSAIAAIRLFGDATISDAIHAASTLARAERDEARRDLCRVIANEFGSPTVFGERIEAAKRWGRGVAVRLYPDLLLRQRLHEHESDEDEIEFMINEARAEFDGNFGGDESEPQEDPAVASESQSETKREQQWTELQRLAHDFVRGLPREEHLRLWHVLAYRARLSAARCIEIPSRPQDLMLQTADFLTDSAWGEDE